MNSSVLVSPLDGLRLSFTTFDKVVVLFSGGTDSLMAWLWMNYYYQILTPRQNLLALYIRTNSLYGSKEEESVKRLAKIIPSLKESLIIRDIDMGFAEDKKTGYIPRRNIILASYAALYGNRVIMAGIKGDKVEDKSPAAFSIMEDSMNRISKHTDRRVHVESPFWGMSKGEIVQSLHRLCNRDRDMVLKLLRASVSCYSSEEGQCGHCPACFRKWVACEYAGFSWSELYPESKLWPWDWPGIVGYVEALLDDSGSKYDVDRSREIGVVLEEKRLWPYGTDFDTVRYSKLQKEFRRSQR